MNVKTEIHFRVQDFHTIGNAIAGHLQFLNKQFVNVPREQVIRERDESVKKLADALEILTTMVAQIESVPPSEYGQTMQ